jgi:hypothetical protein
MGEELSFRARLPANDNPYTQVCRCRLDVIATAMFPISLVALV